MNQCYQVEQLDEEFDALLRSIKPCINYINSPYYLNQYRIWLEKLSKPNLVNKRKRNVYLRELANQIHSHTLWFPFTRTPDYCFVSDIESEACGDKDSRVLLNYKQLCPEMSRDTHFKDQVRTSKYKSLPRNVFSSRPVEFYEEEIEDQPTISGKSKRGKSKVIKRRPKSCRPSRNFTHFQEQSKSKPKPLKVKFESRQSLPSSRNTSYIKMMENVKNVTSLFEYHKLESTSWLDVSESNSTKSSIDTRDIINFNTSDDVVESLDKESFKLESDEDRISPKTLAKDANVIVTDLKKTIEGLQLRLTETIKQNNDLKSEMSTWKNNSDNKDKPDTDSVKKMSSELFSLDVEKLKDLQDENTRRLEDSFHNKLEQVEHNFQRQLDDIKTTYETKIQSITVDKEVGLKDKDQEICRLNDIIEKQCLRMSNEITSLRAQMVECVNSSSSDDKVQFLQKCVAKMDRLFHKAERDYQKQIEKLKHSLEQKEKSMQILLKSQRVQVMSKACAEKQSQFDLMVNNLEVKYVKMLEIQAQQFLETKKKQERIIEYLRHLLDKHSIAYDINTYSD